MNGRLVFKSGFILQVKQIECMVIKKGHVCWQCPLTIHLNTLTPEEPEGDGREEVLAPGKEINRKSAWILKIGQYHNNLSEFTAEG